MNLNELRRKLLAAARFHAPSAQVPHAFEKRILARLAARPVASLWELWGIALWRAVAPCVAVLVLAGVWTLSVKDFRGSPDPLAVALENTVRAPLDNLEDLL
jgi:anti-sigma-K factor RskA